ncbi:MAG: cobalamin B12-binding domain-containing protein [Candidatus Hodarchaeales archaeon]|jgi:corrinoid protein of di/trimethylamine methyltransferase
MDFYSECVQSIIDLDSNKAKQLAEKAVQDQTFPLLEVVEKGFGEGIKKAGDLWEEGEFFLPELMSAAKAMTEAMDVLTPFLEQSTDIEKKRTVVMATIENDIHTIGKTIVSTMLKANGYKVIDLGADTKVEKIIEVAKENKAAIIGVSALLTTTMIGQKTVVEKLNEEGIRGNFKVILGGAPVTDSWVKQCKADGFAENAIAAVALAEKLLSIS